MAEERPDPLEPARAIVRCLAEKVNELTEENAHLKDWQRRTGKAMWQALDVLKTHIGGFDNWPDSLKEAFTTAIIDPRPPTAADVEWAHALAAKHGWLVK